MLKKGIFTLFLAAMAIVPFAVEKAQAAVPTMNEQDQIARVNWNINIGGGCYGGFGGFYGPCGYPYYYPCPPPYAAYPYPYPPYGGYWW